MSLRIHGLTTEVARCKDEIHITNLGILKCSRPLDHEGDHGDIGYEWPQGKPQDRVNLGNHDGEPGPDIDEWRIEKAAEELVVAAGRPAGWEISSSYEREAWRHAARRVVRAYEYWEGIGTARGHRGPIGESGAIHDAVEANFEAADRAYKAHPLRFTETRTLWNTATLEEKEWWLKWIR